MEPNVEIQTNRSSQMVVIGAGAVVVLLFIFFVLMRKPASNQNTNNSQQTATVVPSAKPTIARFGKIDISASSTSIINGQEVTVVVSGSLPGKEIIGYDSLIAYDKTALKLQNVKSTITDFTIFKFDRPNHLSLTAVKKLNSTASTIMNKTPMVELVFQAIKPGTHLIEIKSDIDKESTKMVDAKTNMLYPNLSSIMITVK